MRRVFKAAVAIALVAVVGLTGVNYTNASSISELQQDKQEAENKKEEAEKVLDQLKDEQADIQAAIRELDDKVAEFTNQIIELQAKKEELEGDIEVTKKELEDAKKEEKKQYDAMKLRIQYAYENGNIEYMDTLFTSSEVADMVNKSEYVEQIYNYDARMLLNLIKTRKLIADTNLKLENELDKVKQIEEDVQENKDAIEIVIAGKQQQVSNYQNSIDDYDRMVAEYQADIEATEAAIEEAERKAREAALAAAQNGQTPDFTYTGGALGWPVPGYYTITSTFGPRNLLGMSFHHGMDIACPVGTPVYACESGVVIASTYSYSLGNYIMIDHGSGLTTIYGHNTSLVVATGTSVSKGDLIAYSGNTGQSTGPHCHIGVRLNGSYVDPAGYLQ